MDLEIRQVLTQIVAFLIFLWILKRFAWKPLQKILDDRKEKIQKELEEIEKQKREVSKMHLDYEVKLHGIDKEAKAKVREGIKEGEVAAKRIKEHAEKQAEERLERAKFEIEAEKAKAHDEMKKEMVKVSVALAEKILAEKTTDKEQKKWMDNFMKEAEIK